MYFYLLYYIIIFFIICYRFVVEDKMKTVKIQLLFVTNNSVLSGFRIMQQSNNNKSYFNLELDSKV